MALQQLPLIHDQENEQNPLASVVSRPGPDDLRERMAALPTTEPTALSTPVEDADELEDPNTILRALIADLEESIRLAREMDAELMTTLRRVVPE